MINYDVVIVSTRVAEQLLYNRVPALPQLQLHFAYISVKILRYGAFKSDGFFGIAKFYLRRYLNFGLRIITMHL